MDLGISRIVIKLGACDIPAIAHQALLLAVNVLRRGFKPAQKSFLTELLNQGDESFLRTIRYVHMQLNCACEVSFMRTECGVAMVWIGTCWQTQIGM